MTLNFMEIFVIHPKRIRNLVCLGFLLTQMSSPCFAGLNAWTVEVLEVSCAYSDQFEGTAIKKYVSGLYRYKSKFSPNTTHIYRFKGSIFKGIYDSRYDCYDITNIETKDRCEKDGFAKFSNVQSKIEEIYHRAYPPTNDISAGEVIGDVSIDVEGRERNSKDECIKAIKAKAKYFFN